MGRNIDTIRKARDIRRMFGGIARRYDLLNHLLSLNQDRKWRRRAVSLAPAEGPVLDVCAGTGDMALEWARGAGTVIAADFCHEMLALGREKTVADGLQGRVRLLAADTLTLPFRSGTFGVVSVAFGIRNVSNLRAGIREMARVARDGGQVVILEFTMPRSPLLKGLYLLYFLLVLPFVGNLVSGTAENAYGYLPRSVLNFPGREGLLALMTEEGLRDVRADDLSLGIVNVYRGVKGP